MKYHLCNVFSLIEPFYENTPKACVGGHNIVLYPKLSLEECKIKCNERSDCEAFEYGVSYGGNIVLFNPKDCILNSGASKAGCDGSSYNLDLYVKKGITYSE